MGKKWRVFFGLGALALFLFTTMAAAQGINFSVKVGAVGAPGTGVNEQYQIETPANDVFIGGGCTNHVRLLDILLGLQMGDDINALCYEYASFIVDLQGIHGEPGWHTTNGEPIYWHFSVDAAALGQINTDVHHEVTTGTVGCSEMLLPNEAHGDYFYTYEIIKDSNDLGADEAELGLVVHGPPASPHTDDDLNALHLNAALIDRLTPPPGEFLQPGDLYFSLAAGSLSLPLAGATEDDILTPDGNGFFQVYMPGVSLGIIPGSDLDALFFDADGIPFFSVANVMQTMPPYPNANPGDILVPDGTFFPDGIADELIPARELGLLDADTRYRDGTERTPDFQDDNLNALDAALAPVTEPEAPSSEAIDKALPMEVSEGEPEGEGEGEAGLPAVGFLGLMLAAASTTLVGMVKSRRRR